MKTYQAIRISVGGVPTYGDKYREIVSTRSFRPNEIIGVGNERYSILFKEQQLEFLERK